MPISVKQFPRTKVSNYNTIRSDIRSGDILLCSGSGWFSKMIQKSTSSIWSHVAFVMRLDEIDRVMVLESVEPLGVRTVPLRKYLEDYDSKGNPYNGGFALIRHGEFKDRVDKSKLKRLGQFAVELFGYPYDKDEIAKIAVRIAASHLPFSRRDRREMKPDREFICSEYVYECYKSIGIKIPSDKRGFIAPKDFAQASAMNLKWVLQKKKPKK